MILDVQIQKFGALAQPRQSFPFQKIPGGPNINIIFWKLAWCFLIHERTNAEKLLFLTPEKVVFFCFFLKKNPQTIFSSSCFCSDSALNTIEAHRSLTLWRRHVHFLKFFCFAWLHCYYSSDMSKINFAAKLCISAFWCKKQNWFIFIRAHSTTFWICKSRKSA